MGWEYQKDVVGNFEGGTGGTSDQKSFLSGWVTSREGQEVHSTSQSESQSFLSRLSCG